MKMFFTLFLALGFSLAGCRSAEKELSTTIVLVRHAEKADDGTKDPPLDSLGVERAAALEHTLKDLKLSAVYSSPYKRTRETVAALAAANKLELQEYDPGNKDFLKEELKKNRGGSLLISGHSNTIPAMVNELTGKEQWQNLEDWEYDYLYIVNLGSDTTLLVLHYGTASRRPN